MNKEVLHTYRLLNNLLYEKRKFSQEYSINSLKTVIGINTSPFLPFGMNFIEEILNNNKIDLNTAVELVDMAFISYLGTLDEINWDELYYLVGGPNILRIIRSADFIGDQDYWSLLGRCYTDTDFAHTNSDEIWSMFHVDRQNRHFLMTEKEQKYFNQLPEYITIYRGCSIYEAESLDYRHSWTLDEKVAHFFAYEYIRNQKFQAQ